MKCNAGYEPKDGMNFFGCRYGTFDAYEGAGCNPGFKSAGAAEVSCEVAANAEPEAAPAFSAAGSCDPLQCTDPTPGEHMSVVSSTGKGLKDTATVKCDEGYNLSPADGQLSCAPLDG